MENNPHVDNIAVLHLVGGQYVIGLYQEIPRPNDGGVTVVLHKPMEMQVVPQEERMTVIMHPFGCFYGLLKPGKTEVFPDSSFFSRKLIMDTDPLYAKYKEYSAKYW